MTLSYRPFCPCEGHQVGLWYLPAGWRDTTRRRARAPSPITAKIVPAGCGADSGSEGARPPLSPRQSWPGLSRGTRDAARVLGANMCTDAGGPRAARARPPASASHAPQGSRLWQPVSLRLGGLTAHRAAGRDVADMPAHGHKWLARVGEGVSALLVARLHRGARSAHREDAVYPRPLTSNAGGAGGRGVRARGFLHRVCVSGSWTLWPEVSRREGLCRRNGGYYPSFSTERPCPSTSSPWSLPCS